MLFQKRVVGTNFDVYVCYCSTIKCNLALLTDKNINTTIATTYEINTLISFIIRPVLRFTDSDYPFDIFKLFVMKDYIYPWDFALICPME
jgi:hypothetical protein